jgi:outer membrane murein-binding lipoprotein Lpp
MRTMIAVITAALVLTGCGQPELDRTKAENEELRAQVESLQGEISDIKEKADALETSSGELRSQMNRFQSENWRDVVPDAQAASDQVESDQDSLKSSVDDAGN